MKGREREKGRYTLYIYTRAHKEAQKGKGEGRLEQIQTIRIQKKEKDLLKTGGGEILHKGIKRMCHTQTDISFCRTERSKTSLSYSLREEISFATTSNSQIESHLVLR